MPQYEFLTKASKTDQFARLAAFDPSAVENGMQSMAEISVTSGSDLLRDLLEHSAAKPLFDAIFGNSPFLTRIALRNPGFFAELLATGPEQVSQQILAEIGSLSASTPEPELMTLLRRTREEIALAVAIGDISGTWKLAQVTETLTKFVDAALGAVTANLLLKMHNAGQLALPNPDAAEHSVIAGGSGLFVLGMGKLGSFELNYSSDIDLIILYDADIVPHDNGKPVRELMVKFVQDLVRIIQSQTSDGYVHRVDLRLRPDPASTPAAVSTEFAYRYYESRGRNWERAAMIKARAVAGDMAAGNDFLKLIEPFVWRRHFDFAAIEDIRGITRQLQSTNRHTAVKTRGHDIKIGPGGIREIEFYVQTQQLVTGGRNPVLRAPSTTAALIAIAESGDGRAEVTEDLLAGYAFLRTLEHRIQMINDEQTHTVPADDEGVGRVAAFLGYETTDAFEAALLRTLKTVNGHYKDQFPDLPDTPNEIHLLLEAEESSEEAISYLEQAGFAVPERSLGILKEWQNRSYRVLLNDRTHELLNGLLPEIITTFGNSLDPDLGLQRFDRFIRELPAGVQLFSLFHANPWLLELLSDIFGTAPAMAEKLSRHSEMFDALLNAEFYEPVQSREELEAQLTDKFAGCESYEDVLDDARSWMNDMRLQIGVQQLGNVINSGEAGFGLANCATALVAALLPSVVSEFSTKFGHVPGRGMAVIAMGNFGSRELTMTSDLDLIFVYDASDLNAQSDGATKLALPHYYSRLSQRFINALTAMTRQGRLFEVDMRLRPSGNKGPIATSLDSFRRYHETSSWTWEQMALTRAKVIAGDPALGLEIQSAIQDTVRRQREPKELATDVHDMRERIDREYKTENIWAFKYVRGGLIDLEFLAQFFVLRSAHDHQEVLDATVADIFEFAGNKGQIPSEDASSLAAAYRLQRRLQSQIRLCLGDWDSTEEAPTGLGRVLGRLNEGQSFETIGKSLEDCQREVRRIFGEIFQSFDVT